VPSRTTLGKPNPRQIVIKSLTLRPGCVEHNSSPVGDVSTGSGRLFFFSLGGPTLGIATHGFPVSHEIYLCVFHTEKNSENH